MPTPQSAYLPLINPSCCRNSLRSSESKGCVQLMHRNPMDICFVKIYPCRNPIVALRKLRNLTTQL